ncbi:hypothetical protein DM49_3606 [Burkholderia mallei]|nr:hypothetical protein DM45_2844 [Burkholderia mallei]KOS98106.1 hypothetical protein DM49_3606 [Burkholderia mallei]
MLLGQCVTRVRRIEDRRLGFLARPVLPVSNQVPGTRDIRQYFPVDGDRMSLDRRILVDLGQSDGTVFCRVVDVGVIQYFVSRRSSCEHVLFRLGGRRGWRRRRCGGY